MAKRESQADQSRRPIKVILPNQGKERCPPPGRRVSKLCLVENTLTRIPSLKS